MPSRNAHFSDDARRRMLRGTTLVARTAELTLGSDARTVLIGQRPISPTAAASGYEVALNLDLDCPVEQIGVQAMRNLGWEMSDRWGDGTATAISLAAALFAELCRAQQAGRGSADVEIELRALLEETATSLRAAAQPAEDHATLLAVACGAAGGDEQIAHMVCDAAIKVGPAGHIEVVQGSGDDEMLVSSALEFETGLLSPAFATDKPGTSAVFDRAHIVVFDGRIEDFGEIAPMLGVFARLGKPLLFIASGFAPSALGELARYVKISGAAIAAVQAPMEGDWKRFALGDVAAATGATVFGDECGYTLKAVRPELVGFAERVEIDRKRTRFIGGRADRDRLALRQGQIKDDIRRSTYLSLDRERHRRRLARLVAGVATLRIGADFATLREQRLTHARQAVGAVMASQESGTVGGGGIALRDAGAAFGPKGMGRALAAPYKAISTNCAPRTNHENQVGRIAAPVEIRDSCAVITDALSRAVGTALTLASVDVSLTGTRSAAA